jgi:hypothetical protein
MDDFKLELDFDSLGFKIDDMELNLDNFNIDFDSDYDKEKRYNKPKVVASFFKQKVEYKNAKKLANEVDLLTENSQTHVIVSGNFILGDFIEALIVKNDWLVEDLTLSTLSMSLENIDSINNLIKGKYVNEVNLIISDYFYNHEKNNLINAIFERCDLDNKFQLAIARIHTKISQIKTECGKYITIYGSANLRSSRNIEQITIDNSEKCYYIYREFHQHLIDNYSIINKNV